MNKACPVLLRQNGKYTQILAFRHPLAGIQLVKGSIEAWENLPKACERELWEESGLKAKAKTFLGIWEADYEEQIWGFYLMNSHLKIPDCWEHYCQDGGGHVFQFFWQDMAAPLTEEWHPLFQGAMEFLRKRC